MKTILEIINKEVSISKSRVENINTSSINGIKQKIEALEDELNRLNSDLKNTVNTYIKSNNLNEKEVFDIKNHLDKVITDFLTNSNIPGINSEYKTNVTIKD